MPPTSAVLTKATPAPTILMPVHAEASAFAGHRREGDEAHVAKERERARLTRAQSEGVRGPELGDECTRFGTNMVDQLSHLVTSFVFAPDMAQSPWGVDVSPPHAAHTGIVRLKPDPLARARQQQQVTSARQLARHVTQSEQLAGEGAPQIKDSAMQVAVHEQSQLLVPFNRFLFASTGIASLVGGLIGAAPILTALGSVVFFTNVAINIGIGEHSHWTRQLPPKDIEQMVQDEAKLLRRLQRRIGIWPLAPRDLCPPVPLDGTADSLAMPGDAHLLYRQRSFGWNVSAIFPFVARGGWQEANALSDALHIVRHDERSMWLTLRLHDTLQSGSWLRAGPLWTSGHYGDGKRQASVAEMLVPWPSAQGSLLWQAFGDAYARAVKRQSSWPLPAVGRPLLYFATRTLCACHVLPASAAERYRDVPALPQTLRALTTNEERETVHSHGQSAHWSLLKANIDGHVSQRGRVTWGNMQLVPQKRDLTFVTRGLEESFLDGYRFKWKFTLFFGKTDKQQVGPKTCIASFAVLLQQSSEANRASFTKQLFEALGQSAAPPAPEESMRSPNRSIEASEDESAASSTSRQYISFPAQWARAFEGPTEQAPLLPPPKRARIAPQQDLYIDVTRALVLAPTDGRDALPNNALTQALLAYTKDTHPQAQAHVEAQLGQEGTKAFRTVTSMFAPQDASPRVRVVSASYRAMELRAQIERMHQVHAQVLGLAGADTKKAPDASLLADLEAHAAFWRSCRMWPAPLADAAQQRASRLQALRKVLAPKVADLAVRPKRQPSRALAAK